MCSAIISTHVLQEDQGCVNAKNESKNSMLKSQNTRFFVATDFVPSWRQSSQCRRWFCPIFCWGVPALAARFLDQASPAVNTFFPTGQVIFLSEVLQSSEPKSTIDSKIYSLLLPSQPAKLVLPPPPRRHRDSPTFDSAPPPALARELQLWQAQGFLSHIFQSHW